MRTQQRSLKQALSLIPVTYRMAKDNISALAHLMALFHQLGSKVGNREACTVALYHRRQPRVVRRKTLSNTPLFDWRMRSEGIA